MKKLIGILVACILAMSSALTGFAVYAEEEKESKGINNFIDGIVELTHEYDKGKEFVTSEGNETGQIQAFSAQNSEEVTDITETEYTLQDFQAARLIVRANDKFDEFGAKEHVSGFEDFHILQYESPEAAMDAYYELQSVKNVFNVAPDEVVDGSQGETDEIISETELQNEKYLCDWSHDRTQSKRLQEYLSKSNITLKEVVVGVIDTGVDYNHEFLKERIVRTYFNASPDGSPKDEIDNEIECHGTAVSSVIVDNSPSNVKVAVYRVFGDDGNTTTISQICAGYLKAIEHSVDVLNVSIGHYDESGMAEACIMRAYMCNIPLFTAIGNIPCIDMDSLPSSISECIVVSATDKNNTNVSWNTLSKYTDISAPGDDIPVAVIHNKYEVWSGTSFSAPCAASLGAILKSVYPNITVNQIEMRLKETSVSAEKQNYYESVQNNNLDNYHSLLDGVGVIQFCNALGLEKLIAPELNLEDKVYVGEQTCTITCTDENATILYTTDGTYPDYESANVYKEPFQITSRTRIRAVAYYTDGGYYSDEVESTPRIQYIDSDENFVINSNGIITQYRGNISDLFVPETINGITVTGFSKGAFNAVIGLTLPESVAEIPANAFANNTTLEFIYAQGALNIGNFAFYESNIRYGDFPKAITIGNSAFEFTSKLYYVNFPNTEYIGKGAFMTSGIISFYGPNVKTVCNGIFERALRLEVVQLPQCNRIERGIGARGEFYEDQCLLIADLPLIENLFSNSFCETLVSSVDFPYIKEIKSKNFYNCMCLEYINMPSLLSVPKQAFGNGNYYNLDINAKPRFFCLNSTTQIKQDVFGVYPTSRLELSHLETAESLPQTEGCIISMPSTFRECTEDTKGRNYKVYGTKGTYAEQWANENGHKFIEVSQDTAVLTQLPEKYTDVDGILTADVIGFNRTYQWYANDTNDNTTGTPIPNATGKEFNPADYPAKYYYCVVTSTDVGYDPIEIRTNVTENTTYQSADYTEYNKAVEQAKALDRSLYTDLTELDEALAVDVSGLSNVQQNIVDEQTAKIKAALDNLVLKPADYSRVNEQINTVPEHLEYYTDETVNALNEILNGIDYGLDITKQEAVDSYAEQLQNAISALEYKPADYTEYDKAVAKAKGLDKEKYVDFSQVEKELAVDVGGRNITQQEEVDLQTKAILAAIDALEEKPQEQPIINPEQDKTNGNTTPDKPSKNESVISPMTGSETYTGVFTALAALSFATVLLVRKKKDN
ncbi:S8 family serine peptidase [Ruminococcus sp.]|uniref:S8 family serine peptidase n=1 Tax=Ruminococcus sp. TaxID=41978 RepID=UPI003FD7370A